MYDLLKRYNENFDIDVNKMVTDNVYLVSKLPVELLKQINAETLEDVIMQNDLSSSLIAVIPHFDFTPSQIYELMNRKYLSSDFYKAIADKIIYGGSVYTTEVMDYIFSKRYVSNYVTELFDHNTMLLSKFVQSVSLDVLLESRYFIEEILRSEHLHFTHMMDYERTNAVIKKLIENRELYRVPFHSSLFKFGYKFYDSEIMDDLNFVERYISNAPEELMYDDTDSKFGCEEDENLIDFHFLKFLNDNHKKSYDYVLLHCNNDDQIKRFINQNSYGNVKVISDDNIIKMMAENPDCVDFDDKGKDGIYSRVISSPYIIKKLLEENILETWFFHFNKSNFEIVNILTDYYLDITSKDLQRKFETTFILTSVIIPNYRLNDYVLNRFREYMQDSNNMSRVLNDIVHYNKTHLEVLLDANSDVINHIGDLNNIYTRYLIQYAGKENDQID